MSRPVITAADGKTIYTASPDGRLVRIEQPTDAARFIPSGRPDRGQRRAR